ncbi:MAG: CDP-alcohol phosphatidyltransferase family protein [Desulfobulbaceae bacterium]|nr:MAG: CDP-alcohol phosphatidyltransferase family protein [Desulfobulbaceae bacterium]
MNIPNLISIFRILLVPLLAVLLLDRQLGYALVVLIIAGLSDALDGFFARLLNQQTRLGAILDPVADKSLLITAFSILTAIGIIPLWLTVLVISRDLIIVTGVAILLLSGRPVQIKPTYTGKLTTVSQLLTVAGFLSVNYLPALFLLQNYLIMATVLLTMLSLAHYLVVGLRVMGGEHRDKRGGESCGEHCDKVS